MRVCRSNREERTWSVRMFHPQGTESTVSGALREHAWPATWVCDLCWPEGNMSICPWHRGLLHFTRQSDDLSHTLLPLEKEGRKQWKTELWHIYLDIALASQRGKNCNFDFPHHTAMLFPHLVNNLIKAEVGKPFLRLSSSSLLLPKLPAVPFDFIWRPSQTHPAHSVPAWITIIFCLNWYISL